MKLLIITGGSKGIGKGIVEAYLKHNYQIVNISRSSTFTDPNVKEYLLDLTDQLEIETQLSSVFKRIESNLFSKITLINNAGSLGNVATAGNANFEEIDKTFRLNAAIPLFLSGLFLSKFKSEKVPKNIINISSGAAANPYSGWSIYCATKSALDMITKVIALEQANSDVDFKILSIYPGVVDTQMQDQIRTASQAEFKSVERFIALKQNGELADPQLVGQQIFDLDQKNDFQTGQILDLRSI